MQGVEILYTKEPVFTTFLNVSLSELNSIKEKIREYRKKFKSLNSNKTNLTAWRSSYNTHEFVDYFDNINLKIINKCDEILNDYYKTKNKLFLEQMWVSVYEKGDCAKEHDHIPSNFSCCYYVDAERDSSSIIFSSNFEIVPENDMLIIFPSYLKHRVLPTVGKRYLIAMNLRSSYNNLQKNYYYYS